MTVLRFCQNPRRILGGGGGGGGDSVLRVRSRVCGVLRFQAARV